MITDFATIRGYAVPFEKPVALADHTVEAIGRNAFAAMLATGAGSLPVRWETHDRGGEIIGYTSQLFADDYGLGFEVVVDMRNRGGLRSAHWSKMQAMMAKRAPSDQVSIGGFEILAQAPAILNGIDCACVTKATIDHVTITATAAYRHLTGAWVVDGDMTAAPWRLQVMAAQWDAGRSAATASAAVAPYADAPRRGISVASAKTSMCIGKTVSGHAVMMTTGGKLWKRAAR